MLPDTFKINIHTFWQQHCIRAAKNLPRLITVWECGGAEGWCVTTGGHCGSTTDLRAVVMPNKKIIHVDKTEGCVLCVNGASGDGHNNVLIFTMSRVLDVVQ